MKKQCKRKHWKLVNPIEYAIEGASKLSQNKLDKVRTLELSALESFVKGKATKDDWRQLAHMCNISEAMTEDEIGKEEVTPALKPAQEALAEAHRRFTEHGKLGLSGLEIQALREIYQWHDAQRTSINLSRYEKAIESVRRRIVHAPQTVRNFA